MAYLNPSLKRLLFGLLLALLLIAALSGLVLAQSTGTIGFLEDITYTPQSGWQPLDPDTNATLETGGNTSFFENG